MHADIDVIWQNETSVWFQQLLRGAEGTYLLRREYATDPRDGSGAPVGVPELHVGGAALLPAVREPEWPTVDVFALSGDGQLSARLLGETEFDPGTAELFRRTGALIADLHRTDGDVPSRGYHLGRLAEAIDGSSGPSPTADLGVRLSAASLERVRRWLAEPATRERRVSSHGNLTMNSVFVDRDAGVEIPYGPEAGMADREFDVGWLLGELTELEYAFTHRGLPGGHIPAYAQAFVDAYEGASGAALEVPRLARVVAMRVLLHYLDFAETMPELPIGTEDVVFLEWLIERAGDLEDRDVPA